MISYIIFTDIDDCSPDLCLHGTCTDGVASYTCSCENGWEGVDCNQSECSLSRNVQTLFIKASRIKQHEIENALVQQ